MPLGSSSDAPVISPGPNSRSQRSLWVLAGGDGGTLSPLPAKNDPTLIQVTTYRDPLLAAPAAY
jgi:hypothetical protein